MYSDASSYTRSVKIALASLIIRAVVSPKRLTPRDTVLVAAQKYYPLKTWLNHSVIFIQIGSLHLKT